MPGNRDDHGTVHMTSLWLSHGDAWRCVAESVLKDWHRAHDVAQETVLIVARTMAGATPPDNPGRYGYMVARNEALRVKSRLRETSWHEAIDHPSLRADGHEHEDAVMRAWREGKVAGALRGVSERDALLLFLRYWCGLSAREIAATLGIGDSDVVDKGMRDARRRLGDSILALASLEAPTRMCVELDRLCAGLDGPPESMLTPKLRKSVARHVRSCACCSAFAAKRADIKNWVALPPALLLALRTGEADAHDGGILTSARTARRRWKRPALAALAAIVLVVSMASGLDEGKTVAATESKRLTPTATASAIAARTPTATSTPRAARPPSATATATPTAAATATPTDTPMPADARTPRPPTSADSQSSGRGAPNPQDDRDAPDIAQSTRPTTTPDPTPTENTVAVSVAVPPPQPTASATPTPSATPSPTPVPTSPPGRVVPPARPLPNLVVVKVGSSGVVVRNTGASSADPFVVRISALEEPVVFEDGLAPSSVDSRGYPCVWEATIEAHVDPDNRIAETNEDDNRKTGEGMC